MNNRNRHLSAFTYIIPIGSMDLYGYYMVGYGDLRILIHRNTGEQILGYVVNRSIKRPL